MGCRLLTVSNGSRCLQESRNRTGRELSDRAHNPTLAPWWSRNTGVDTDVGLRYWGKGEGCPLTVVRQTSLVSTNRSRASSTPQARGWRDPSQEKLRCLGDHRLTPTEVTVFFFQSIVNEDFCSKHGQKFNIPLCRKLVGKLSFDQ